jgi:hypothetical protein
MQTQYDRPWVFGRAKLNQFRTNQKKKPKIGLSVRHSDPEAGLRQARAPSARAPPVIFALTSITRISQEGKIRWLGPRLHIPAAIPNAGIRYLRWRNPVLTK